VPVVAGHAGHSHVRFAADCQTLKYKPKTVSLACGDGNGVVTGARWSAWGSRSAAGRGTARLNSCSPSCAQGTVRRYRVTLKLAQPLDCRDGKGKRFTRLAYTFTGARPKGLGKTNSESYGCPG